MKALPLRRFLLLLGCFALATVTRLPAQAESYRKAAREAAFRGDNDLAVALYEKALSSAAKVFLEDDIELLIRRAELGEAYRGVGRWKEAISQLDYAWKRARFDSEKRDRWLEQEGDIAMNCAEKLARACQGASRYEDALMVLRTSIEDHAKAKRPNDEAVHLLALETDTLLILKRDEEAGSSAQRAVALTEKEDSGEPVRQAKVYDTIGNLFLEHGYPVRARPFFVKAVQISAAALPPHDENRARMQQHLANALIRENDLQAAELLLNDSLQNLLRKITPDSVALIPLHLSLCDLAQKKQKADDALKHATEAMRICRLRYSEEQPQFAEALFRLGRSQTELKKFGEARKNLTMALQLYAEGFGQDHPETKEVQAVFDTLPPEKADAKGSTPPAKPTGPKPSSSAKKP